MSYGFAVYNDLGDVQIDSMYKNYMLHSSGSAAIAAAQNPPPFAITFPPLATPPIIAFKATTSFHSNYQFVKSGGLYVGANIGLEYNVAGTLSWRVYAAGQSQPLDPYGMVVMNGAGEVVFNSADIPLDVVGVYPVTHPFNFPGFVGRSNGTLVSVQNSDNYFVLTPYCYAQAVIPAGPYGSNLFTTMNGFIKQSSTTLMVRENVIGISYIPQPDLYEEYSSPWHRDMTLVEIAA